MNVNYEYYRTFYYVAKMKNVTQAAEFLCMNQPNVSRTMRLLEEQLGCKLLVRSNRGIALTPEGEHLYRRVETAVKEFQAAEDELMKMQNLEAGQLTIHATATAMRMVVLPALGLFKQDHPAVHVQVTNQNTVEALELIRRGQSDFAVILTPVKEDPAFVMTPLVELRDHPIAGPAFSHLCGKPLTLKELASYPLIGVGESMTAHRFYEDFFHSRGLELKPELEASSMDLVLPMIKSNLGIGFLSEFFVQTALKAGEVHRLTLDEPIPARQVCFVESAVRPLSIAAKELKRRMIQYAAGLE